MSHCFYLAYIPQEVERFNRVVISFVVRINWCVCVNNDFLAWNIILACLWRCFDFCSFIFVLIHPVISILGPNGGNCWSSKDEENRLCSGVHLSGSKRTSMWSLIYWTIVKKWNPEALPIRSFSFLQTQL